MQHGNCRLVLCDALSAVVVARPPYTLSPALCLEQHKVNQLFSCLMLAPPRFVLLLLPLLLLPAVLLLVLFPTAPAADGSP